MTGRCRMAYLAWFCLLMTMLGAGVVWGEDASRQDTDRMLRDLRVLAIIPNEYGANTFLYLNHLERLGWDITTAGLSESIAPCSMYAKGLGCPNIVPELVIDGAIDLTPYDALILMPSSGNAPRPYRDILADENVLDAIARANDEGLVIAAQCSGPRVLGEAGILEGRRVVARDRFEAFVTSAGAEFLGSNHPPVIDGNLVTAVKGLYYSLEYVDAISSVVQQLRFPRLPDDTLRVAPVTLEVFVVEETADGLLVSVMGGPCADAARGICPSNDGGSYIAGFTYSFGGGSADALVIKTDADASIEWARALGGASRDEASAIAATSDGGCILTGVTESTGSGGLDLLIARFDGDGNLLWSRTYGGSGDEEGLSICRAHGAGYVIAGHTQRRSAEASDAWMIKIDDTGSVLWEWVWGDGEPERANDVIATHDGGYLVSGFAGNGAPDKQFYAVKTNGAGILQWERRIGDVDFDSASAALETAEGGFILVGFNDKQQQELMELTLVETDSSGTVSWRREYGRRNTYDYGTDLCSLGNGQLVVCGVTNASQAGENEAWIHVFADPQGQPQSYVYGGIDTEWLSCVCPISGTGFMAAGFTRSKGSGSSDVLIVRRAPQE